MPDRAELIERAVLDRLDVRAVTRWAALVRSAYATYRSEIDSLNVFPVPDGDTGTNLYLTFDGALDGTRSAFERPVLAEPLTLASLCREVSRAMLLSARGNSGVILSQIFQGLAQYVSANGVRDLDGKGLAGALAQADALAWACVAQPQEGTILSVSRAAATRAQQVAAGASASLLEVSQAARAAAREALLRTPEQLPALKAAGVVDAGGAGCVLLLEALVQVVTGESSDSAEDPLGRRWVITPVGTGPSTALHPPARMPAPATAPAYEVMYLLSESDDGRVQRLRAALAPLGDSLLVVGGDGQWSVHVHVNDVGAAIEAGIEAGRPRRISVTSFVETARSSADVVGVQAVAACAAGPGLADVMRAAGATVVLSGPARRASAGELLAAVRSCHAGTVILLPNDSDTELAAQAAADAASQDGIRVRVVQSRTAVQGLAALAVFDAATSSEDNVVAMSRAAAATRHGGVTVALKEALTSAGRCSPGDVLGIVDGDFALIGSDLYAVAETVLDRLLASGGELLTVVTGQDAPDDLATVMRRAARSRRREVEVTEIVGGQPLYPLLLGVE